MVQLLLAFSLASLVVEGKVVDAQSVEPLPWATVEVLETGIGTTADSLGRFRIDQLPNKNLRLVASHIGYLPDTIVFNPSRTYSKGLYFRLKPEAVTLPVVEVTSSASLIAVAEPQITLRPDELRQTPGNFGDDILRSLPALPGIGMSGDAWSGPPVIRGGDTDENPIYYDGVELPWAWHLAGFNTIINSDFTDSVTLCMSAIPIRYDALSAVTLVSSHRTKDRGGRFAYDAIGLKGAAWTTIGKRADIAASLRKTTYHIFFGPLGNDFRTQFYDLALNLGYALSPADRLSAGILQAGDDFGNNYGESVLLCRAGFQHRGRLGFSLNASYTTHYLSSGASLFLPTFIYKHDRLSGVAELSWRPSKRIEFVCGEVIGIEATSDLYDSPSSFSYAQLAVEPVPNLFFTAGVRLVRIPWTKGLKPAPRTTISWKPHQIISLTAGYRDSYQHPFRTLRSSFYHHQRLGTSSPLDTTYPGDATLEPKRVQQYSISAELSLDSATQLKVEAYHRDLSLLPLLEDSTWTSNGYGYGEGLEVSLRMGTRIGFWAELTYAFSATKRLENDVSKLCWGDYDQRHILGVRLCQVFRNNLSITSAFKLATGRPYTPVIRDSTGFAFPGEPNSARADLYHRLDLRVEKRFPEKPLSPYFYIEIINLFNVGTPYWMEEYIDSTGSVVTVSYGRVPFLPVFGVGGSF